MSLARLGRAERERVPRDEVAHVVGDVRLEARRIRRRNRRRLARHRSTATASVASSGRPERAADAQHPLARVDRQDAAAQRAGHRRHARRRRVDAQQGAPQLQLQVAFQARDDRQMVDGWIVVESHDDQRLPVVAPPAPAGLPDRCAPARGSGAPAPDRRDAARLVALQGDAP
jgi:hypothetical protein